MCKSGPVECLVDFSSKSFRQISIQLLVGIIKHLGGFVISVLFSLYISVNLTLIVVENVFSYFTHTTISSLEGESPMRDFKLKVSVSYGSQSLLMYAALSSLNWSSEIPSLAAENYK